MEVSFKLDNPVRKAKDLSIGDIVRFNHDYSSRWTYIYGGNLRNVHYGIVLKSDAGEPGGITILSECDHTEFIVIGHGSFTYKP